MELIKNELVEVKIIDMNNDGEGVGKIDGYTLFIKDSIIGDLVEAKIIKAKKNYGYARLVKIIEPSPYRVEPRCPVAKQCGGCQLQALDYSEQLRFKGDKVKNNLERIGSLKDVNIHPVIGMDEPYRYRNKAQFPVGINKKGDIITGFYAARTHSIIEADHCDIGIEENAIILDKIKIYMKENHISPYDEDTHKGILRHVLIRASFDTKEIMVCLVINGDKLPESKKLVESLRRVPGMKSICLNVNRDKTNVILGEKILPLWGDMFITDAIGDIKYKISPLSFYQVNPIQTQKLYEKALEAAGLTGEEVVWDLYCGIGTISLFLAQRAKKVHGVEIVPAAIENAKENALLNQIENVEFYLGKAEEVLPKYYSEKKAYADVIVVDPPRKGCDESLLNTMLEMQPKRIVYVSCDSATLARDLKILSEGGYEVTDVWPVDMFPQTVSIENVVRLIKK
ncbi:MAG: 23S rRNA (uracil(1939)-C(5))-methyltransferase RlmD [Clostridiales bacterium]|nr:23S rRNA (uracil(1939)-C(5))-methyltransferase RlmD [Clostridiales bacterium]